MGEPLRPNEATQYRALAARLNYLALDRADIQFATKEVARYMATPSEGNWLLLKRMGRYLKDNPRLVQVFRWQVDERAIRTYTDSDWAGDKFTRKSVTGWIVFIKGCPIAWSSKRQSIRAGSIAEAEFIACHDALVIQESNGFLKWLLDYDTVPFVLFSDNLSAITISKQEIPTKKSKHFALSHPFLPRQILSL